MDTWREKKAVYLLKKLPMILPFKGPVKTVKSLEEPEKLESFCVMQSVQCCKTLLIAGW